MQFSKSTKTLALLCALLTLLSLAACGKGEETAPALTGALPEEVTEAAFSAEAVEGDFAYMKSGAISMLTAYRGEDAAVSVPETLGGCPVTIIGEDAFKANAALTTVDLPNGVTEIGDFAFWGCTALSAVTLPESLVTIGDAAFMNCFSLAKIRLPAALERIGVSAFSTTALSSVIIPEKVDVLAAEVFGDCPALVSVVLPATVTEIDEDAFYGSKKVTITCAAGSAAETFAKENGVPYSAF